MPLTPSDSVDAFLSWLATPTIPLSTSPPSKSGRGNHQHHKLGANQSQSNAPSASAVPPTSTTTGMKLRELSKSPLEDMALPLLLTVSPVPASARPSSPRDAHTSMPKANANSNSDLNAGAASQPSPTEVGGN